VLFQYDHLETLDLAVVGHFTRDARVGRTGRVDRNGENDTDDAGAGGIPRLERRETWGTRGAALPTATSRSENDSITWEMIDRAAERLEKEK
jgi:hypothetical protein